jgi:hypothetical protein
MASISAMIVRMAIAVSNSISVNARRHLDANLEPASGSQAFKPVLCGAEIVAE